MLLIHRIKCVERSCGWAGAGADGDYDMEYHSKFDIHFSPLNTALSIHVVDLIIYT